MPWPTAARARGGCRPPRAASGASRRKVLNRPAGVAHGNLRGRNAPVRPGAQGVSRRHRGADRHGPAPHGLGRAVLGSQGRPRVRVRPRARRRPSASRTTDDRARQAGPTQPRPTGAGRTTPTGVPVLGAGSGSSAGELRHRFLSPTGSIEGAVDTTAGAARGPYDGRAATRTKRRRWIGNPGLRIGPGVSMHWWVTRRPPRVAWAASRAVANPSLSRTARYMHSVLSSADCTPCPQRDVPTSGAASR